MGLVVIGGSGDDGANDAVNDRGHRARPPVVLVTGSTSGIGRAIARRFLADGADVIINSRDPARAAATAAELSPGRAVPIGADIGDPSAVVAMVDEVVERFGRIDVLVNNAGMIHVSPAVEVGLADWQRMLDVHVTGAFVCSQAVGIHMIAAGSGTIINIGSLMGHGAVSTRAAYTTAKHALVGLTKVLAVEWGPLGIRVVSVDPGYTETEMVAELLKTGHLDRAAIAARTPLGRLATVDDVAEMVVFLASERASFISGQSILVDGAWLAAAG